MNESSEHEPAADTPTWRARGGDGLRVGILAADLDWGHGWGRYSAGVVAALRDAGVHLTVIAARNSPPLPGVTIHPLLPSLNPLDRGMLRRQLAILPRAVGLMRDCEVIHALVEPYAPLAARLAGRRPLFVTGHGSYVRANQMRRPPASWVYAGAFRHATLICVSRYTERAAREALSAVHTEVVGSGVEAALFGRVQRIGAAVPTLLFVGAVKARKGVIELIGALARIRETLPDARLRIVGALDAEPAYVERVRRAIAAFRLNEAVELAGRIPEPALLDAYSRAHVFVLPSLNDGWKFEGFGLTLLEASAAGLPVIGTRDCGAEDAVIDGVTGLLVPQAGLERALADAALRLLTSPDEAVRMGEAGRRHAAEQTWARTAERLIALYRRALHR